MLGFNFGFDIGRNDANESDVPFWAGTGHPLQVSSFSEYFSGTCALHSLDKFMMMLCLS